MAMNTWILASTSPRRHELMREHGLPFIVVSPQVEEVHDPLGDFIALCRRNAQLKAEAVRALHPLAWIIAADTLVGLNGQVLGKPSDLDEARAMLRQLSSRSNDVCTAVCLLGPAGEERLFHELSTVHFRALSDDDISAYFALVNPLDKAGAYALQEHPERIITHVEGDPTTVVGLPMPRLLREIHDLAPHAPQAVVTSITTVSPA